MSMPSTKDHPPPVPRVAPEAAGPHPRSQHQPGKPHPPGRHHKGGKRSPEEGEGDRRTGNGKRKSGDWMSQSQRIRSQTCPLCQQKTTKDSEEQK